MNYRQPPYSTRYPEILALEKYYQGQDGVPPENSVVMHNVCVGKWLSADWHATPEMLKITDNLVDSDPRFVDAAKGDFRLQDDSPAFKLGFKPIPFDQIGLGKRP
jgi:hypothetical protein